MAAKKHQTDVKAIVKKIQETAAEIRAAAPYHLKALWLEISNDPKIAVR